MSPLARLSRWQSCGIRGPAWRAGLLLLLPMLGSGAEEERPIPRPIIGGERATAQNYPFVAKILRPDKRFCTGSIIAPSWVLTAAHCLMSIGDEDGGRLLAHDSLQIYHGWGDGPRQLSKASKRLIPHPQYRDDIGKYYDIALIELSQPFPASISAGLDVARRSAEEEYAPSGTSSVTLGYGRIDIENTQTPDHMNSLTENLYHAKDCRDRLNIQEEELTLHEDSICSGTPTRRANNGDSGGPLIVSYSLDGNTRWLQVGVANRVAVSTTPPTPPAHPRSRFVSVIYARVSTYADWLHTNTQGAISLVSAPDPIEEITEQLSEVNSQISSLQATAQSLQNKKTLLKQRIDEFKDVEGQDRKLQTTEAGILNSVSTVLAQ